MCPNMGKRGDTAWILPSFQPKYSITSLMLHIFHTQYKYACWNCIWYYIKHINLKLIYSIMVWDNERISEWVSEWVSVRSRVNVQVFVPNVISGRIHWLKTFLFVRVGSVPFIVQLCLPNVCHPALILLLISMSWFFSINVKRCPM